ncbi:MAG: response regulator transcription factor [Pseudomonadota bacterium]
MLDSNHQIANAASAYRAGASAYFANVATSATFIKYLELVMLGETIIPAAFLRVVLERAVRDDPGTGRNDGEIEGGKVNGKDEPAGASDKSPMQQLSAREKTILRCIIEGCSNKAIARKVAISEATVKVHVKSILRKFRVHSRTQAAIWGMSCSASQWEIDDVAALNQITAQASAPQHAMPALPQAVGGETAMSRF